MKLFVKQDIKQGEIYPRNTFLSYGNSLFNHHINDCKTLEEQVKDKLKMDGWYIKVEIPFTRNKLHINPDTFEQEFGPTRYMLLFRYRPYNQERGPIKFLIKGWFPV